MIIVSLWGGLGNQMFQYAAGRALAERHRTQLKLDVSPFREYTLHSYALSPFRIHQVFASQEELDDLTGRSKTGIDRLLFRLGQRIKPPHRRAILREMHFRPFNPRVLRAPRDVCLQGYWQSERYFKDIETILRREFQMDVEPDPRSAELAGEIRETSSVGVHVRRGDYASDEETSRIHGTLELDYYRECVKWIRAHVRNTHLYVFSDDPDWVADHLTLDTPMTLVTHNDASRNYEDLRLMSLCRHNIIANSTFGWWAAWLNDNPDKIVLAPKRWFRDPSLDTRDLLPGGWMAI